MKTNHMHVNGTGGWTLRSRNGSALLVAMGVIAFSSVVGAMMVTTARQQVFAVQNTRDFLIAKATAEAGVNDAYEQVKSNFRNLTATGTLNDGTYSATVTVGTNQTGRIVSVGRVGLAEATVSATVFNFQTASGQGAGFNYAILCGGAFDTSGSMTINNGGTVHANGAYYMSGSGDVTSPMISSSTSIKFVGSSKIIGNVKAPVITNPDHVSGTKTVGAVPTVQIPTMATAMTNYYNIAVANGQVFSGKKSWTAYSPQGGVVWVNGDISLTGSSASTACFICTGNFKMSGSGNLNQVSNYPAVISTAGNVNFTGSGVINGLVYAPVGRIDFAGSTTFSGSLICGGKFNVTGSGGIMNYVYSGPSTTQDHVVITAWE